MSALKGRLGLYHHAKGALGEGAFNVRLFKAVIAFAYNTGIVILDEDNHAVAPDQHMKASSGYYDPTREQRAEFESIMAMDWAAFTGFCRQHPRFRAGSTPDIDVTVPRQRRLEVDRIVFPASAKDADRPYLGDHPDVEYGKFEEIGRDAWIKASPRFLMTDNFASVARNTIDKMKEG